jgi:hypothetical protein
MIVNRRALVATVAAIAAALVAAFSMTFGRTDRTTRTTTLEVEIQSSAGSAAQLFWSDDPPAFDEARSTRVVLQPSPDRPQRLRFRLPASDIRWLRLDPTDAPADLLIGDIAIFNADGAKLGALDPGAVGPLHQLASKERTGAFLHLVSSGNDPYLMMQPGCLFEATSRQRLFRVSRLSAAVISALVVALLAACAISIASSAFGLRADLASGFLSDSRLRAAIWVAALFVSVFAARLLLMNQFPLTVPYQDQWDAEARRMFLPMSACELSWRQMFSLHNEHRVFFTRLLSLDLLWLDGQWDPRLQQVANAVIQSLTAVLVAIFLWMRAARRHIAAFALLAAATFGLPFAWENTLQGFQSSFYFLELFSVLALWMIASHRTGSRAWWLGWVCAACALFTAAGALAIPLAITAIVLVRYVVDRLPLRHVLFTIALSAAVLVIGLVIQSPPVPYHAVLRAQSIREFAGTLSRSLAWPWIDRPTFSLLMWLPLLVAASRALRHRSARPMDPFAAGLAAWVALQAAAIAYGRGAGGNPPISRYQDALSLGLLVNTYVLVVWLDSVNGPAVPRRIVVAAWALLAAVGINARVGSAAAELTALRILWNAQADSLRRFVATGDAVELAARPVDQLAYPDAAVLASLASHPFIQRILPASVRAPVHVEPRRTDDSFVLDGVNPATPRDSSRRSWGSLSSNGPPGAGRFESREIQACALGGRLEFQITGFLGFPGQRLWLRGVDGRVVDINPGGLAAMAWRTVTVPCPTGPYEIVGEDAGPTWFGFREPIEIGSLSAIAEFLIAISPHLLLLALALALFASRRLDAAGFSP